MENAFESHVAPRLGHTWALARNHRRALKPWAESGGDARPAPLRARRAPPRSRGGGSLRKEGLEGTWRDDGDTVEGAKREEVPVPGDQIVRAGGAGAGENAVIRCVAADAPAQGWDGRDHAAGGEKVCHGGVQHLGGGRRELLNVVPRLREDLGAGDQFELPPAGPAEQARAEAFGEVGRH